MDNLKLHRMQLVGLNFEMKSMKDLVEETKRKQEILFYKRLPALAMIKMAKKLKEESQLSNNIIKVEKRMTAMEHTLHTCARQHSNQ